MVFGPIVDPWLQEQSEATASQLDGWGEAASTATVDFPLADLLAESAVLLVLTLDLRTESYVIVGRHALIQEDIRRAQAQKFI
jgi:hypothetical protein